MSPIFLPAPFLGWIDFSLWDWPLSMGIHD